MAGKRSGGKESDESLRSKVEQRIAADCWLLLKIANKNGTAGNDQICQFCREYLKHASPAGSSRYSRSVF